jgi:hypothetical protein
MGSKTLTKLLRSDAGNQFDIPSKRSHIAAIRQKITHSPGHRNLLRTGLPDAPRRRHAGSAAWLRERPPGDQLPDGCIGGRREEISEGEGERVGGVLRDMVSGVDAAPLHVGRPVFPDFQRVSIELFKVVTK